MIKKFTDMQSFHLIKKKNIENEFNLGAEDLDLSYNVEVTCKVYCKLILIEFMSFSD